MSKRIQSEKGEFIVVPIDTQQLKMGEEIVLEKVRQLSFKDKQKILANDLYV